MYTLVVNHNVQHRAIPNLKKFERQRSSVQRTSSITNDQVRQHMPCHLHSVVIVNEQNATSVVNGMETPCAIPLKDIIWPNLLESHVQNGGEHNSLAWQKNVRTYAKQLLPNLDDITSLVLNLVRTEVATATPASSSDRACHYVPQCNMKHKGSCICKALGKSNQSVISSAQCLSSMPTIKHMNRVCHEKR